MRYWLKIKTYLEIQPDNVPIANPNIVPAPQQPNIAIGTDEMDSDSPAESMSEQSIPDNTNMEIESQPSTSQASTSKQPDSDAQGTDSSSQARPAIKRQKLAQSAFKSTNPVDNSASDSDNIFLGTDKCLYRPAASRDKIQQSYKKRLRSRIPKVKYFGYPQQSSDSES